MAVGRDAEDAIPASAIEVRHQDEVLGALSVRMPANDPMDPAKERLIRDLAAQAGLVLRNAALIDDLKASRVRLVAAQNEERRRIERNIHDGAQQQLVALAVKLWLADTLVGRDEERAHAMLAELQTDTNQALEDLRDLARGSIRRPRGQGSPAALESQARKSAVPVTVESDGIGRYPQEAEAAVYFSCLEALQNGEVRGGIGRHGPARADERRPGLRGRRRRPLRPGRRARHRAPGDRRPARRARRPPRRPERPGRGRDARGDDPGGGAMNARTASRLAWSLWGRDPLVANVVLSVRADTLGDTGVFVFVYPIFLLAFATVGALIAARQPGNAIGWVFIGTGLAWAVLGAADAYAAYALATGQEASFAARAADWVNIWFYGPGIFLPVTLLLLLFPDGQVPSPRWRPVLWIAILSNLGVLLGNAFDPATDTVDARFLTSNPFGVDALEQVMKILVPVAFLGDRLGRRGALRDGAAFASIQRRRAAAVAMARVRGPPRRAGDRRRDRRRLDHRVGVRLDGGGDRPARRDLVALLLPITAGIAILKYRLYDIDVVINKTVVYGLLAAIVTGIYVAIVVGFGTLVGAEGARSSRRRGRRRGPVVPTAATARAAPREPDRVRDASDTVRGAVHVLERLADTYSVDDVLPRVARVLGEGSAPNTWRSSWGRGSDRAVPWRAGPTARGRRAGERDPSRSRHQGDTLGEIRIAMPANEAIDPSRERLAADVAAQAGLVLAQHRFADPTSRIPPADRDRAGRARTQARAEHPRRRAAAARRPRGEARLVERTIARDTAAAERMVAEAKTDTNDALENLRDLARGIYLRRCSPTRGSRPPSDPRPARRRFRWRWSPTGSVATRRRPRRPCNFLVPEALQNVAKYAEARHATVRLSQARATS